jgi:hypothetical protein
MIIHSAWRATHGLRFPFLMPTQWLRLQRNASSVDRSSGQLEKLTAA